MPSELTWRIGKSGVDENQPRTSEVALNSLNSLREAALMLLREVECLRTVHRAGINGDFYEEVQRYEIDLIRGALQRTHGNQRRAARLLGMKPTTLNCKIKKYGISTLDEDDGGLPA